MTKPIRCCNLDWLEVHALEPVGFPHDPTYFRSCGLLVNERGYGTRVYREMFTVSDQQGNPFVEVRRDPYSTGYQGLHTPEECHLRLVNAACYDDHAANNLRQFMQTHGYQFNRVSRVDICLDFEFFDRGDNPADFVRRYFKQKYAKINQGNITAHGSDSWSGQNWNSLSWGAPSSPIGTKLYNKTLELYDPATDTYRKPHIRYSWFLSGLIDDFHNVTKNRPDGTTYKPQIWRVEFSIRSSVKNWTTIELNGKQKAYQSIRNTLDMYDSRDKLLLLFASLSKHYFHFKYMQKIYDFYKTGSTEGKAIRKDRCPDKILFDFGAEETTYKVGRNDAIKLIGDGRTDYKPIDKFLQKVREYQRTHSAQDIHDACQVLIRSIEGETLRTDLKNPWSYQDLLALRQALSLKSDGNRTDVAILMREIKHLLNINDQTAIF